ncbi:MAG: VWA domain-containing protein, partial [Candidatus Aminicenantes bacterium]|nr:VWA domain-containing protein [Candidatus Aminicenantes bacterium]
MKNLLFLAVFLLKPLFLELYPHSDPIQTKKEQQTLQYEVAVTLKLVQVYVTDKKGNPVVDLKKEDFIIYDKGKKQPITEFEKHILHLPSPKTELQSEVIQESILPAPRELMSRKFFLLFDFAYNNPRGTLKAKKAALHFINTKLQPSDEVGVLSYSALKSLKLHEYLTADHTKVRQVVESFGLKEIHGRAEDFEDEYWRQISGENPLDPSKRGEITFKDSRLPDKMPMGGEPSPELEKLKSQEGGRFHALYFVKKMSDFAKALRYIPGYKHIILFSSGIPYSLIYGIQSQYSSWHWKDSLNRRQVLDLGDVLLRPRYEDMLKELATSNSTIYTLDTEDLVRKAAVDSRAKGAFTLQTMASSTGGKYFGNINSYEKHLEKIQNLTGYYYILGFYIDEKWDGKYHKIKVKVNRPGCKVHAQKGYFNPKPFSEYSKFEKMLHLVDLALSGRPLSQTPVRFPLAALPCSIKGKPNLALFSKIPMEKIREFSGKDVEIISIIFDKENNIVKIERDEKDFSKLPKGPIYYSYLLSLNPGDYKCRLVMRNLETGRGAVASSSVKIPKGPDYGIKLYPPLLLKPEKGVFYLKRPSAVYPFDSSQYSPLVEELDRGTNSVLAVVRCSFSGIRLPDIKLFANLIHHLA